MLISRKTEQRNFIQAPSRGWLLADALLGLALLGIFLNTFFFFFSRKDSGAAQTREWVLENNRAWQGWME